MPYIATGPNGERKAWNGASWVDLPRNDARGSSYLPGDIGQPDKSEAAYYNAWRKEQDPGVDNAAKSIASAREMEGLMAKQPTGGIYSIPVVGDVAGWFDPEIRRMDSLSSAAARASRQPGEGTISDFDAAQFLKMTYGKSQPTQTNQAIIRAQRAAADATIQRRTFNDWYYRTYGNRLGADEAWTRYAQDNPIFDPASEAQGSPKLNSGRQNWRQYFGAVRGPGDERDTVAATDLGRSANQRAPVPAAARQTYERYMQGGKINTKAKPGLANNPYLARDADELSRIPAGSYVIAPDGSFGYVK